MTIWLAYSAEKLDSNIHPVKMKWMSTSVFALYENEDVSKRKSAYSGEEWAYSGEKMDVVFFFYALFAERGWEMEKSEYSGENWMSHSNFLRCVQNEDAN